MSTDPQREFSAPIPDQMRVHRPLSGEQVNSQQAEVESVTVHGREYLVFPVIAAREMVLDYPERNSRELLPSRHLQESVSLWEGTPLVFVHPENERKTADDPREYTQTIIGMAYQPEIIDKTKLRVMAYIDVGKARDIGGLAEDVVDKLKRGEALGVSAGYATLNDDHEGGVYNGEDYDVEQGHIIPDHIAVFPNDEFQARCDWEDGCGAPRVNFEVDTEENPEDGSVPSNTAHPDPVTDKFDEREQAELRADALDCDGTHVTEDGQFMPCESYEDYLQALTEQRQNRLTACEVVDDYDLDRETAETVRATVNEYKRSESLAAFKRRLNGNDDVDVDDPERVYAMLEEAPTPDVTANLREGQYVQWDWSGGTAYGQITEIVDEGTRSVEGNKRSVDADDDQQIAVIEQYSQDGELQNQRVVKYVSPGGGENEDNLRAWDAPSAARENMPKATETCPECGCGPDESHELGCSHAGQSLEGGYDYTVGDLVEWIAFPDKKGQVEHIDHEREIAMVSLVDINRETGQIERTSKVVSAGLEDLRLFAEQVNTKVNISEDPDKHTLARVGEWVKWDERGSESYGQITAIVNDGCLEVATDHKCVDESDGSLVARIQRYSGEGEPRSRSVVKFIHREDTNEDGLRKWRPPREARVNAVAVEQFEGDDGQQFTLGETTMQENAQDEDPVSLLGRFLQSIGRGDSEATVNAAEATEALNPEDGADQTESETDDTTDEPIASEDESGESETTTESDSDPEPDEVTDDEAESTEEDADTSDTGDDGETDEVKTNQMEDAETTETDDGDTSDDNQDMKENQLDELSLEQVAAKTAFGITELEDMDDQMLRALERTVQEMSEEIPDHPKDEGGESEGESGGQPQGAVPEDGAPTGASQQTATEDTTTDTENNMDDDSGAGDSTTDEQATDQFLTHEEAEETFATKDDLDQVTDTLEDISSTVENIAEEQQNESIDEEAQIVANAIEGMDVEAAKELPEEKLSELAEKHAPKANFAAVPGSASRVQQNAQSSGDADDYPAGGRSNWEQRQAEGGD